MCKDLLKLFNKKKYYKLNEDTKIITDNLEETTFIPNNITDTDSDNSDSDNSDSDDYEKIFERDL
jgi:hypothetical protein|tara:strand:+ start:828 stop:1022 length:195 start_codon:yes stop_codon:yes gene_type:complete